MIRRYFEGETSVEEERALREYLSVHEVPASLQRDKELILRLHPEEESVPAGLEDNLSHKIDEWELQEIGKAPRRKHYLLTLPQWGLAAAAVVALLVGLNLFSTTDPHHDTCSSPQIASVEADRALGMLARALNHGEDGMDRAGREWKKAGEQIDKQLSKYTQDEEE